tara:strand:- start:513 stop:827 length:315 start_codon:yes stop_codon:yes gene_type:complete
MKLLREYIREMLNEQMELQAVINDLDNLSADELMKLWQAASDAYKRKDKEIKAGFKKGDKVEFDHEGKTITGIVAHRGAKFVSVNVRGYSKPWKRTASSLRRIS